MVARTDVNLNGNGTGSHTLMCESDYEAQAPSPPRPRWRDEWPIFTHNLNWSDSDNCQHSMTVRADNLDDLMTNLRLLKNMIRLAKAQTPATEAPDVPAERNAPTCPLHGVVMERRLSKRTGGSYFAHRTGVRDLYFGRKAV